MTTFARAFPGEATSGPEYVNPTTGLAVPGVYSRNQFIKQWRSQHIGTQVQIYLRNLAVLRTSLSAQEHGLIDSKLQMTIAQTLRENGLDSTTLGDAIASGTLTIPTIDSTGLSTAAATSLHELQGAIVGLQSSTSNFHTENLSKAVVTGAVQGAATGSGGGAQGAVIGAITGAIGGYLGARQRNKEAKDQERHVQRMVDQAASLASPEHFQQNFVPLLAAAREETLLAWKSVV